MLARHLEHVTVTDPPTDLPALAELLDTIPDPRSRQGRRYRLGPLLALSLLAVLGGATSLAKIARFIAGYDPDLRARAGLPGTVQPAASTLGRLFARLDGDAFDVATCTYMATLANCGPPSTTDIQPSARTALSGLAVDGKTLRGSRTPGGAIHLLAATRHDTQTVVAQRQVDTKSNEIPAFTPLLSHLYLTGVVVTADALHTQHDHAHHVIAAGGHYLFIVKGNQPTLLRRLKALPWREAILNDRTDERGHGRHEIRRMKICSARPGLPFPHAAQAVQAVQVKRRRTDHRTGKTTIVTIYAITDLPPRTRHPYPARCPDPRPLEHRSPAPHPRRHLPRRLLPHSYRCRTPHHGQPAQPGHRPDPPDRLDQHRRRHRPLPQPPSRRPAVTRFHNMRTQRPWYQHRSNRRPALSQQRTARLVANPVLRAARREQRIAPISVRRDSPRLAVNVPTFLRTLGTRRWLLPFGVATHGRRDRTWHSRCCSWSALPVVLRGLEARLGLRRGRRRSRRQVGGRGGW
ncbi:ISAs1 family transposase [Nonomuraea fuscirosea]|uniref:ISAs1 family transposase n=1 Tax=Nonomuraea fuscirosea TaxID=1291556 RepID=UPI0033D46442